MIIGALTLKCITIFMVFTISRLYETKYKADQGGVCGITCNVNWAQPRDEANPDDLQASENNLQFNFGWYLHPIALDGKYPEYMRTQVDTKSAEQGKIIKNNALLNLLKLKDCFDFII